MYRHKELGYYTAFYCKKYDITNRQWYNKFEADVLRPSKLNYNFADYEKFMDEFEFVPNDDYEITISSLTSILTTLRKNHTKLILLLGSEKEYPGEVSYTYQDREKEHMKLNAKIRSWANDKTDVILFCFDNYLNDDKLFLDTINHFKKIVYFQMAKDLVQCLKKEESIEICAKSILYKKLLKEKIKQGLGIIKKLAAKRVGSHNK